MHAESDRNGRADEADTLRAENTQLKAELEQSRAGRAELEQRMQRYEQVSLCAQHTCSPHHIAVA